jgi:hypothetical protein
VFCDTVVLVGACRHALMVKPGRVGENPTMCSLGMETICSVSTSSQLNERGGKGENGPVGLKDGNNFVAGERIIGT